MALDDTEAYVARCLVRGAIDLRLAGPHQLEFDFVLARADWGRGLMTEMLRHTVPWALAQPGDLPCRRGV